MEFGQSPVESVVSEAQRPWQGRRILVTGHTGFKGAWLSIWLDALGAKVIGLSLPPENPSLYRQCGLDRLIESHYEHNYGAALARLNEFVHAVGSGHFATVWYCIVDREAMTVSYATAGHVPPLLFEPSSPGRLFEGAVGPY